MEWTIVIDLLATLVIAVFSALLWFVTKKLADAAKTSAETAKAEYLLTRKSDVYLEWSPPTRQDGNWVITFDVKANVLTTIESVEVTHTFSRIPGDACYTNTPPAAGKASPHRSVSVHARVSGPQKPDALEVDVKIFYIDSATWQEDSVTFHRCYTQIEGCTFRAGDRFNEGEKEDIKDY